MRWKSKPISKVGDKKIVTKFLWFPKKINRETRWLEKATWEEEYQQICESEEECYTYSYKWIKIRWIDYSSKETEQLSEPLKHLCETTKTNICEREPPTNEAKEKVERFKNKLYKDTEGKKGDN